ncbi:TPA: conserved hypothetical protein [Thermocrinis Great Boiling Spring virus]|jgi:hypothetical protein|nr:TPA: conserved hypothetical protein [Thermocrinis Great Boiling Spring virus]
MEQIDWNQILQELEQLKQGLTQQEEQPQQTQEEQSQQVSTTHNEASDHSQEWDYWLSIGRQTFINKYAFMPNFAKYLPVIEQRAMLKLQQDLQTNKVKDTYDAYLEEALKDVLKEFASITQDFSSLARYMSSTQQVKQVQKPYTQEDYYEDYKKMLERITVKDIAHIRFDDGSKHSGYWGQPQLELGAKPNLDI